ncbi:hypothetical protein N8I77_011772 [Diaporthe amygdali]|uniref:Uncharacterized protein n=1 Tax=Phomopsis amygdali TaxID=1214568 RepID=A0AAD9S6B7_PHOAM|nr:hypothetical protein N8I77_011772 [Diaporthe amygdali]
MASLSKLPDEIIILIVEVCDVPSKAFLARSNWRLNSLATEVLYRYNVQHEGNSAMYWAAEHGHVNALEQLRSCGAELNDSSGSRLPIVFRRLCPDSSRRLSTSFGFLPLHVAAKFGQDAAVEWFLRNGARIESLSQNLCRCEASLAGEGTSHWAPLWTPLHIAICNGNLSTTKLLISHEATVENSGVAEFDGNNVLHIAARCNNTEAIEFLVGSGLVDVDEPDSDGSVALHYACSRLDNAPALEKLLEFGASVNILAEDMSPLLLACERGFFEAALKLVNKGAIHDVADPNRNDLLHIAWKKFECFPCFRERPVRAVWEEHREAFIRRLAELGANVDDKQLRILTPLALVVGERTSLLRTIKTFLDVGADVNAMDRSNKNLIYLVLDGGDFDASAASKVELLLRYGARLDLYARHGYCAFDHALDISRSTGNASVIDFILQHASVANFGDGYLNRVVAHSYTCNRFNECRLLIGHGAVLELSQERLDKGVLHGIARKNLEQLIFHLDHFPSRITTYKMIEIAVRSYKDVDEEEIAIIKSLLDRLGSDSDGDDVSQLLRIACKYHLKVDVAQLLLERGGRVNSFDPDWETALGFSVDNGCRHMVKCLLHHGADPHLTPPDQLWSAHVREFHSGPYLKHLALGDTRYPTAFMRAIAALHLHGDPHESCQAESSEVVLRPLELMLEHLPPPPIPQDPQFLSYIHFALAHPPSLRLLLAKGADPNSGDHCTRPPLLHFLTMANRPTNPEALSILLEFGADIHRRDGEGKSFLTMMRNSTLAMANNADDAAELELEKLDFAGLLVRNFFITLDAKSGEDCVRSRPLAVAEANYLEYVTRLAINQENKR